MEEYNGKKVFRIKKDERFIYVYEDDPDLDLDKEIYDRVDAICFWDDILENHKREKKKIESRKINNKAFLYNGFALALSLVMAVIFKNPILMIICATSCVYQIGLGLVKGIQLLKIKDWNYQIHECSEYIKDLQEEKQYLIDLRNKREDLKKSNKSEKISKKSINNYNFYKEEHKKNDKENDNGIEL